MNPLKQGLKPSNAEAGNSCNHIVKEVNPLKQGLKLLISSITFCTAGLLKK